MHLILCNALFLLKSQIQDTYTLLSVFEQVLQNTYSMDAYIYMIQIQIQVKCTWYLPQKIDIVESTRFRVCRFGMGSWAYVGLCVPRDILVSLESHKGRDNL